MIAAHNVHHGAAVRGQSADRKDHRPQHQPGAHQHRPGFQEQVERSHAPDALGAIDSYWLSILGEVELTKQA